MAQGLRTLEEGVFSTALKGFLGLQDGEATSAEWAGNLVSGVDDVLQLSDGRLDFEGSAGEYTWDPETETWSQTGSSDDVVLRFPAAENASGNNATFVLDSYSDTEVEVEGASVYLPTALSASLTVDGTEIFAVDLSNVDYATDDDLDIPIPQSFALTVFTAPHTHQVELVENSSTDFDLSFELSRGDDLVVGLSVNAQLTTDDYDDLEVDDVREVSGEGRIGQDLTVPFTIQVAELVGFDDPTEEQINDRIDASVEYRGQEIATLRYDQDSDEIELVFSDGTVKPASEFFEDFIEDIEDTWSDYFDDFDVDLDTAGKVIKTFVRP